MVMVAKLDFFGGGEGRGGGVGGRAGRISSNFVGKDPKWPRNDVLMFKIYSLSFGLDQPSK